MPVGWIYAFAGGVLIGIASSILLLTHGRVAGISGIAGRAIDPGEPDRAWRLAFVAGMVIAGVVASLVSPSAIGSPTRSTLGLVIAGLLVGYGTRLGNGCTSGHGVCGIGRGSARSMVAAITFIGVGMITATLSHLVTR
jgi:uncharacterized membrane protein YedE/YeeE